MDRFPRFRGRRASWYGGMDTVLLELSCLGRTGIALTQGGSACAAVLVEHLVPLVMGERIEEPDDILRIWRILLMATQPYGADGIAAMARSAIDLALWDLLGQLREEPVYSLLGGAPRSLPVYATGDDIEDHRERGLLSSKIGLKSGPWHDAGLDLAIAQLEHARERAGNDHELMVDAWMGLTVPFAAALGDALARAGIEWIEEPLLPNDLGGLEQLSARLNTPIATGEHVRTVEGLLLLSRSGAGVIQPDLAWCGGLTALREVSGLLSPDVEIAPHLSGTPWGVHAASTFPSIRRVEWYVESLPGEDLGESSPYFRDGPVPVEGRIRPSEAPGLGISLDRSAVAEATVMSQSIDA